VSRAWRRMRRRDPADLGFPPPAEWDDGYRGPAILAGARGDLEVTVHLTGHLDPHDGRYHWFGRVDAGPEVVELRAHAPNVTLRIGAGPAVPGRLSETDTWGNPRIVGVGRPPYPVDLDPAS
jgi:hypothetical protein